jgi:hypothetical protein
MLDAKVKLKNFRTGQEFLLLVVKMNPKGILVRSSQPIELNTPLKLSLQLAANEPPLELRGEVHKIAKNPGGSDGVIVRFVSPSPEDIARITEYLKTQPPESPVETTQKSGTHPPPPEPTAPGALPSLSKMALSSPDRQADDIAATEDEEALHEKNPGLAGKTRMYDTAPGGSPHPRRSPIRSGLKMVGLGALLLIIAMMLRHPALRFLDQRFGLRPVPTPAKTEPAPSAPASGTAAGLRKPAPSNSVAEEPDEPEEPARVQPTATATPERPTPKAVPGNLTAYDVQDAGNFLKVSLRGTGDFTLHSVSRATNPKRLILDFPRIPGFSAPETMMVGKNPVLRIRTQSGPRGIRVFFDLYPVEFPRTQIKGRMDSVDIFFQR